MPTSSYKSFGARPTSASLLQDVPPIPLLLDPRFRQGRLDPTPLEFVFHPHVRFTTLGGFANDLFDLAALVEALVDARLVGFQRIHRPAAGTEIAVGRLEILPHQ